MIALAALGSAVLLTGPASAIPNGSALATLDARQTAGIDQVRWVCNPWGRCHWRPNFYRSYGFYGPRRAWRGGRAWGGGHHWRRW